MGAGAPLRWIENRILRRYIRGRGIEVGALWKRFPVPNEARVWYTDRISGEGLEDQYSDLDTPLVHPDVIADAEFLPFKSSLNFIIASHVLEHLKLPLVALRAWYDSLAPGGVLLLRVPDKRFTFDTSRQRTSLSHLIREQVSQETYDLRSHYADWVEHIEKTPPAQSNFETSIQELMARQFSIHFHVWTDRDVREILDYTICEWKLAWRPLLIWDAHYYRKEVVAVMKKDALVNPEAAER